VIFAAAIHRMEQLVFNYLSPHLNAETAPQCQFRAILGVDSISMLVTHRSGEAFALKNWHLPLHENGWESAIHDVRIALGQEPLLEWEYERKIWALSNRNMALIPRRYFQADQLAAYFDLLLRPQSLVYHSEPLPEFDCHAAWAAEPTLAGLCKVYAPDAEPIHGAVPLLKYWSTQAHATDYSVFANFRHQQVQIGVFDRQNLAFFNTFDFQKPADALYFTLLPFEQHRLSPVETPLHLSGNLLEDSDIYRLLYRYFRRLSFSTLPAHTRIPTDALEEGPAHRWLDVAVV
jgi:hypothetical protein